MIKIKKALLLLLGAGLALLQVPPVLAGGPVSITHADISVPSYQSYLSCSCDSGEATIEFQNEDSMPLTLVGQGWQVGPIAPDQTAQKTFTDPGVYSYKLAEYPTVSATVTILNKYPEFPSGSKLSASNITSDSITLSWSKAQDDGGITAYKIYTYEEYVYTKENLVYEGPGNVLSTTIKNLKPATNYNFMVEAWDSGEYGQYSRPVNLTLAVKTAQASVNRPASPSPSPSAKSSPKKASPTPTVTATSPTPSPEVTTEPTPSATPSISSAITVNNAPIDTTKVYNITDASLRFMGTVEPGVTVVVSVHSDVKQYTTLANESGVWRVTVPADEIAYGDHEVTMTTIKEGSRSDDQPIMKFKKDRDMRWLYLGAALLISALGLVALAIVRKKYLAEHRHKAHAHHAR